VGIDVDPDLRKAARMNMVMNEDGHGNIFCFNSLEFGVPDREVPEMGQFAAGVPGLAELWKRRNINSREFGVFDFILPIHHLVPRSQSLIKRFFRL
jgi:type I restriction enzyme M protein